MAKTSLWKGLGLLMALACPGLLPATAPAGAVITDTGPMAWGPASATITAGQRVDWSWGGFHGVVSDTGSEPYSSAVGSPGSFSHTFNTPGDYAYHCPIHGLPMSGFIHVDAPPSPTITDTFTESPTPTPTLTVTDTFTDSPTPTITLTATPIFTPTATPAFAPSGLARSVLGPVPAVNGQPLCLYFDQMPSTSHWDIFNLAGERVANVDFGAERSQCWATTNVAPGIYLVKLRVTKADGSVEERWQKVAIIR